VVGGRKRGHDGLSFTRGGTAVGILMAGLVSLGIILTKIGTVETGAVEASTVRIVVAIPGILLIDAVRGKLAMTVRSAVRPQGIRRLIAASIAGTYIAYILFIAGIKYAHPGVAIALAATSPAFVIPLSRIFLKERSSALAVAGTAVAIAGIVILFVL
jgi:drug/metabolite transporter (DMT)-like permease